MKRQIVYPSQIPLETHILGTNKSAMMSIGKLAELLIGQSTVAHGFECTPTVPASLSVKVGAGEMYKNMPVDSSAYSTLGTDTAHSVVKQGLLLDETQLSVTAPTASGSSQAWLVQVSFSETDTNSMALPYYNASNPSQPFTGQNNNGLPQPTIRECIAVLSIKAGVIAPTGSQVAPSADTGAIGLYVINVATGQTAITASDITKISASFFETHSTAPDPHPQYVTDTEAKTIAWGEGQTSAPWLKRYPSGTTIPTVYAGDVIYIGGDKYEWIDGAYVVVKPLSARASLYATNNTSQLSVTIVAPRSGVIVMSGSKNVSGYSGLTGYSLNMYLNGGVVSSDNCTNSISNQVALPVVAGTHTVLLEGAHVSSYSLWLSATFIPN